MSTLVQTLSTENQWCNFTSEQMPSMLEKICKTTCQQQCCVCCLAVRYVTMPPMVLSGVQTNSSLIQVEQALVDIVLQPDEEYIFEAFGEKYTIQCHSSDVDSCWSAIFIYAEIICMMSGGMV